MRFAALLIACMFLETGPLFAQLPELTSSDRTMPIRLSKLDISVKMIGTRSSTTFRMTFYNAYDQVLEGSFVLPLPEGAAVTRYALDINGIMREGVPVEKTKASQVFESVEKRRVDPGLFEKTEGNVYRTRIYPIPAHGSRSVIISYEQELSLNSRHELLYHLPLSSKDTVPDLSLAIDVQQKNVAPSVQCSPIGGLDLLLEKGHYCAHECRENVILNQPLDIRIAKLNKEAECFVQKRNGAFYFYLQTFFSSSVKNKSLPRKLNIIWDNSLSGLYRKREQEIKLLEAYLKQLGTATIELYTINNTFKTAGVYEVRKGSANALISYLQKIVYDGGTDYSKIRFADADETLLFTDGLSTLSDAGQLKAPHAVYTITSSAKANFGALKSIAELNAGSFINLAYSNEEDAIKQLTMQALSFLGVRKNKNVAEHYPSIPTSVQNGFSISGQWNGIPTVITLQFGYGKVVAFEQSVSLHFDEYEAEEWDLAKLFAQKKILQLEQDYDHHSDQILQLGKQYSIVTRNTSLLVLENVMDYVRNEIEPPTELRSEYKRLLKERRDELSQQQQHTLDNAIKYSNQLWQWYHTSYPVKRKAAVKYIDREASDVVASVVDTAVVVYDEGEQAENLPPPPPPQQESQRINEVRFTRPGMIKDEEVAFKAFVGRTPGLQVNDVVVAGYGAQLITTKDAQEAAVPEIRLQEKTPAATYLKVLSTTPRNQQYQTYLELREKNLSNPTFYYDVATFFLKQDRALGLQILTNLADLDFENHELLKLLAFQLRYLGQLDQQQYVFKKILLLRPQEPQSYRDYAMALAEKGRYQAALDTLYLALKKDYNTDVMERYEGIEETIVTEINHLISKYNTLVHPSFIHPKHIHSMPVDIRVVLNWNMNDTDIDLWVTDPGGEKCFYSNRQTRIGGRMSEDFTDGYGPEQFLLKKAVKGKYQIQVNYYGESGVKIAGKTTLLAEVFTNYGRSTEQRKLITLQLEGEEKEGVYVGTFVF